MSRCGRKYTTGFGRHCADQRGFTLVEIMVAVAILAIMSGMLIPMIHKVWESNEKIETRQKMADLKRAMVGDQRLIQNGIRMHYGFVGDNGDLPANLSDLVEDPLTLANWHGPYLVGAFDPNGYYKDAWGHSLIYTIHDPPLIVGGQSIIATLRSLGPDGQEGTDDDLNEVSDPGLQILKSEVSPTTSLQLNLDYVFTAPATISQPFSTKVYMDYHEVTGIAHQSSDCIPLGNVDIATGEPVRKRHTQGINSVALPIGPVAISSDLYENANCSGSRVANNETTIYISDGLTTVAVNMPTLNYALP